MKFDPKAAVLARALDRRVANAKSDLAPIERDVRERLQQTEDEVVQTRRALQDAIDEEFIRTRRDPEETPRTERDPDDVVRQKGRERDYQDATTQHQRRMLELQGELESSAEGRKLIAVTHARDEWLSAFCDHYGCLPEDIDWEACEIKEREGHEALPAHLNLSLKED